jgi:hypothetical protein
LGHPELCNKSPEGNYDKTTDISDAHILPIEHGYKKYFEYRYNGHWINIIMNGKHYIYPVSILRSVGNAVGLSMSHGTQVAQFRGPPG